MSDPDNRSVPNSSRRQLLAALGGTATVALAGCIGGDDDDDDETDPVEQLEVGPPQADKAQAAWERVEANPAPEDEDIRNEAYIEIEEAVRDDMILLPIYHGLTERFWYNNVDVPLTGALGSHHQQHNLTEVEGDDTLNLVNATFSTLDPAHSTDTASAEVINQMYEALTHYPSGVAEMENKLLEGFEVSDDGLTWEFTVRDDVQFHDGRDLSAHDVKYSWERLALSDNSTRANFILGTAGFLGLDHETDEEDGVGPQNAVPDSLGLEVIDDNTLQMEIANPNPGVLDILTYTGFAVMPEGYVDDVPGYDGENEWSEIDENTANGTGPFTFDDFTFDEEAQVSRNDDYYGEEASVETVHWEIIEDDEANYTYSVREQNADIFGIPTAQYNADQIDAEEDDRGRNVGTYLLEDGPEEEVNYLGVPELSTFYFGFNAGAVPKPVRYAVALVLNHETIVEQVFEGRGVEAFSFTPPPIWPEGPEGYDEWLDEWPYGRNESNIDVAESVLEEHGHTEDDPFELTLTTYESEVFQEAAEQVRERLAGTGVDIDLEEAPFGTLLERGRDGDLEMFSLGWIWSWEDVAYGHFGFEPKNTNTSNMPGEATGYYLDWHLDLDEYA